jgi:hypothetical protein
MPRPAPVTMMTLSCSDFVMWVLRYPFQILSSFRGAPLGASPESISPARLLHDEFSDARLRIMAHRLRSTPE